MPLEKLITRTRLRVRWLRAARFASWGLLGGLTLSFIYLGLVAFRWLPDDLAAWLIGFNGGLTLFGAIIGRALSVDTPHMLYGLDRSLHTGEVLVTLHDLEKRGQTHDFTSILKHQFQTLDVQPQHVFHLNVKDTKRGSGILALLLINLILVGFGPDMVSFTGTPFGSAQQRGQSVSVRSPEDKLLAESLRTQLEDIQQELDDLGLQHPNGNQQDEQNKSPQDALINLYQNLNETQSQVLGLTSSLQSSQNQGASSSQQRQEQREQLEKIQQQLQQILEQLQQGQTGGEIPPATKNLQESLAQLPKDDPLRQQLEQAVAELQQETLQQAQTQLGQRLQADQSLESLREQLEEWMGKMPEQDDQNSNASGREGSRQQSDAPTQESNEPGHGAPSSGQTQQEQTQGNPKKDLEGSGEGSDPGVGTGEGAPQEIPLDWAPEYKQADLPPNMVEAESLEEWLSRGVPVESKQVPGQPTQFRLSYDQVETLLDLRDLSPELRDVVRLYFLRIIGQLNQVTPEGP